MVKDQTMKLRDCSTGRRKNTQDDFKSLMIKTMRIVAVSRPCGRIAPYIYLSKRSLTAGMMYSCTRGHLNIRRISMGTAMKSHLISKTISEQT